MRPGVGKNKRGSTGTMDSDQLSVPSEDLLGATQAPSAFPVIVQHTPAYNSDHAYNELTWIPIIMLELKHFKEAMV